MPTTKPTPTTTAREWDRPVLLAGALYAVTEYRHTYPDGTPETTNLYLAGPRGGVYFLRGFLGQDTGVRQVISTKSGQPLRVHGNEVRVLLLGDTLEQYVPRPKPIH